MTLDRRLLPGDKLRSIQATTWNAMQDAARSELAKQHSQSVREKRALFRPVSTAKVRNDSGGNLPYSAAVAIRDHLIGPTDNLGEFLRVVNFEAHVADSSDLAESPQRLAILIQPLGVDAIGSACLSGIVPCKVDITDTSHRWAQLTDGETYLTSGPNSGPAEIVSTPDGTGQQWVYVRLPGAMGGTGGSLTVKGDAGNPTVTDVNEIQTDEDCFILQDLGSGAVHLTIATTFNKSIAFNQNVTINNNANTLLIQAQIVTFHTSISQLNILVALLVNISTGPWMRHSALQPYPTGGGSPGDRYATATGDYYVEPDGTICRQVCNPATGLQATTQFWLAMEETGFADAIDKSGQSNDFEVVFGVTDAPSVTGAIGNARRFDNSTGSVGLRSYNNIAGMNGTSHDWYFSCYFYINQASGAAECELLNGAFYNVLIDTSRRPYILVFGSGTLTWPDSLSTKTFHKLIAWSDRAAGKHYLQVDGGTPIEGTFGCPAQTAAQLFLITGGNLWDIYFDEVMGGFGLSAPISAAQRAAINAGNPYGNALNVNNGGTGAVTAVQALKNLRAAPVTRLLFGW